MTQSGSESNNPGRQPKPEPVRDAADRCAHELAELKAAFDAGFASVSTALADFQQTWDTGIDETVRRLDEMRKRTDQLVRLVSDNLPRLEQLAAHSRH